MAKVVVVDDSKFLAKLLKSFFEEEGHEVLGIGLDGNEGFELYKMHQPDLVTLDLTMPNRDGKDCLSDILLFDSSAKVLIVSAIQEIDVVQDCLQIGAKGFLEKPLRFQDEKYREIFHNTVMQALTQS